MSSDEKQFHPDYARAIAQAICSDLETSQAVEKIEIVGGLRRGLSKVRGVSIIYISKIETIFPKQVQTSLFSNVPESRPPKIVYLAEKAISKLDYIEYRVDEDGKPVTMTNHPLRMKALVNPQTGVPIDLYPVESKEEWGVAMALKTGPSKFVQKLTEATQLKNIRIENYKLVSKADFSAIPAYTEEEFFTVCGIEWIKPEDRL